MEFFSLTDIGLVREKNQDSYMTVYNAYDDFFALVCDGIGGNKAGEVASGEVVKSISDAFVHSERFESETSVRTFLTKIIKDANHHVFELSRNNYRYKDMGTTITGIIFTEFGNFSVNIGDSRVYGFKNHKLFRLTEDHTLVNEMLKNGEISYEESLNHPKRHYLMKAVGIWDEVTVDIAKVPPMEYYLVCSDGLHGYVSEKEIQDIMEKKDLNILQKTKELMQAALLKGGHDNITIVLVKR